MPREKNIKSAIFLVGGHLLDSLSLAGVLAACDEGLYRGGGEVGFGAETCKFVVDKHLR